jgi:hypothetical protein
VPHVLITLALLLSGQPVSVYRGEVRLPVDLYTETGAAIPSGKYGVEIRTSAGAVTLAFLSGTDVVASIDANKSKSDVSFTIPVAGTILLRPVEKSRPEVGDDSGAQDRSPISPYLGPVSWNTTLRIYKATSPSSHEGRAIFRNLKTIVEFPLYTARPQQNPGRP